MGFVLEVVAREGAREHDDGATDGADPLVLLLLVLGVHVVRAVGRGHLEAEALVGLLLGRLDREAVGQVDQAVGRLALAAAEVELVALEHEVPLAPLLEPHAALGQLALVVRVGDIAVGVVAFHAHSLAY